MLTKPQYSDYTKRIRSAAKAYGLPEPHIPPADEICSEMDAREYALRFAHIPPEINHVQMWLSLEPDEGGTRRIPSVRLTGMSEDGTRTFLVKAIEWEEFATPQGRVPTLAICDLSSVLRSMLVAMPPSDVRREVAGWYGPGQILRMWLRSILHRFTDCWARRKMALPS